MITFEEFFNENKYHNGEHYFNLLSILSRSSSELEMQKILTENNIEYADSFLPFSDRKIEIDFAFPDKKIALEINGPHHYNTSINDFHKIPSLLIDSSVNNEYINLLTDKFIKRHDFLVSNGWRVIEFPITLLKNKTIISNVLDIIKNSPELVHFDYSSHKPNIRYTMSVESSEELKKLFTTMNSTQIARKIIEDTGVVLNVPYLSSRIRIFASANGINHKVNNYGNRYTEVSIEKIKDIINSLPNKDSITLERMVDILKSKGIPISHPTLKKMIKEYSVPEWRNKEILSRNYSF